MMIPGELLPSVPVAESLRFQQRLPINNGVDVADTGGSGL